MNEIEKGEPEALTKQEQDDLISLIRLRYQAGEGADYENRRLHSEDLAFVFDAETGAQWDPLVLGLRKGRPSYTFNRVLQPVNMLLGDQRQSAPSIKVRPVKNGSQDVADVLGGLWRSIEQDSRADEVYAGTYKHAVGGGYGEMMLIPEFESDDSMDQVLRLKHIPNPLTVVRDPESTDPWGADQMWCMVGDRISKDKYDAEYPGDIGVNFSMSRDGQGWRTDGMYRIVSYFEKIPVDKEIAQLSDGRIIDYTDKEKAVEKHLQNSEGVEAATVVRTRKVRGWKVRWCKCDGARILEGPIVYDWKRIPVVRMPGRYVNIEGKQKYQSLIRHSKDAQRTYNFQSSDAIERSALITKAPLYATPKMILGFEDIYNSSNVAPRIYMPFNVDPAAASTPGGGSPFRMPVIDPAAASVAMAEKAAQDIQATTGFFDPALGNAEDMNRVSGKALVTHTRRTDLGSHEFIANYAGALKLIALCGFDMAPTVYDTERVIRIIGQDGIDKLVTVNKQNDDGEVMLDLKEGTYDCDVTLGPSYETARQETLQTLLDAGASIPGFSEVIPDLIARAIDSPDSEEMYKRLRKILIQKGIADPTPEEKAKITPPQPNPLQQAQVMREMANAHEDAAKASLAIDKANNSSIEQRKIISEVVKNELANLLSAQQFHAGNPEAFIGHLQTQLLAGAQPPVSPAAAQAA